MGIYSKMFQQSMILAKQRNEYNFSSEYYHFYTIFIVQAINVMVAIVLSMDFSSEIF